MSKDGRYVLQEYPGREGASNLTEDTRSAKRWVMAAISEDKMTCSH
jgi:hypothetical protein